MDKNEKLIWAAGYLSNTGTLLRPRGRLTLLVKTNSRGEALKTFVEYVDMDINLHRTKVNGKPGYRMTISGKRLHELMKKLWPYLTKERQHDYARVRRASAQ